MCEGCTAAKPEGCTTAAADCNTDYCGYLANGGQRCLPWCNTYTCASHPIDCGTCAGENGAPNCVDPSTHCESWCNEWTTNSQYCVPGATGGDDCTGNCPPSSCLARARALHEPDSRL